ncbi:hypothetical protein C8R44DRAFT_865143 [Mycena epipterygia]|nr:hypothetical protein C8R44DRAFT_865143 [Mycena epipterygia]
MESPTGQLAQELVDHIIDLLHDSPADWPACALVSRSWVYPAQSHIFRRIPFDMDQYENDQIWAYFLFIFESSPHLIRHVRQLDINALVTSARTFRAICDFPFTHVDEVSLIFELTPSLVAPLQQLLSAPTLRRVQINGHLRELSAFWHMWDQCSAGLRHIEMSSREREIPDALRPTHPGRSPIHVESLRIEISDGVRDWLTDPVCPLDFSGLKILSLFTSTELLGSPNFMRARSTIEILDFDAHWDKPTIDVSSFPNLRLLRISINLGLPMPMELALMDIIFLEAWPRALATLSTIAPSNRIVKIEIVSTFYGVTPNHFYQLDSQLAGLPMPHAPIVELQTSAARYAEVHQYLPQLRLKNTLRRGDEDPDWFKTLTAKL